MILGFGRKSMDEVDIFRTCDGCFRGVSEDDYVFPGGDREVTGSWRDEDGPKFTPILLCPECAKCLAKPAA